MEQVQTVIDRIGAIESVAKLPPPAAGFSTALSRQMALAAPGIAATAARTGAPAAHPAVTLGEMLAGGVPLPQVWQALQAMPPQALAAPPAAQTPTRQYISPLDGRFTSDFGPRIHPVTGEHKDHNGVDLAAPIGTPIAATAAGTVSAAGPRGGYGNLVIIDHADGSQSYYAHQDRIDVRVGQTVAQGEHIGTVGATGRVTGPHLHFEIRRGGTPVDPAPLIGLE